MPVFTHNRSTHRPRQALRALGVAWLALSLALTGYASESRDHERARAAVQAGQVLPLGAVLERLARSFPGQVLQVELEQDEGVWIYEVKLLSPSGQLSKLKLDARNAELLSRKSRPAKSAGQGLER